MVRGIIIGATAATAFHWLFARECLVYGIVAGVLATMMVMSVAGTWMRIFRLTSETWAIYDRWNNRRWW